MWTRILRFVVIIAVVDARGLSRSEFVEIDRSDSSGSDEVEIFVSHDSDGKAMVSKKYLDPPPGKNVYMVKRVNPKTTPVTERLVAVTSKSWSKILTKLGDVHEEDSSEEVEEDDHMLPPLNIRVSDSREKVANKEKDEEKNPSDPMVIAQKLFPVLLRRAIDNLMNNVSQHDRVDLIDELSQQAWKSEVTSQAERQLVNRLLKKSFCDEISGNDDEIYNLASKHSAKHKRSYYSGNEMQFEGLAPPYVVNIFNNSHIGYLVLKPACNFSGDVKNCSDNSPIVYGPLPQSLNFSFALPNLNLPCVQQSGSLSLDFLSSFGGPPMETQDTCSSTLVETTITTPSSTTTSHIPFPTTTTATEVPSTCEPVPTTTCEPPPMATVYYPPAFYHPISIPEPHVRPWYKLPQTQFYAKKPFLVPRPKYDERVIYDPYKHLTYDIAGDVFDCSDEEVYRPVNYKVKREHQQHLRSYRRKPPHHTKTTTTAAPSQQSMTHSEEAVRLIIDLPSDFNSDEIRDDAHLRNTLAKIGLSLDTERPPVAKSVGSVHKSRYRTLTPTRTHRNQGHKIKTREVDDNSQKRSAKATVAPATFLF